MHMFQIHVIKVQLVLQYKCALAISIWWGLWMWHRAELWPHEGGDPECPLTVGIGGTCPWWVWRILAVCYYMAGIGRVPISNSACYSVWMLAKGAFIYITATYNYHQHLYHRRGGKTLIRAASLHTWSWYDECYQPARSYESASPSHHPPFRTGPSQKLPGCGRCVVPCTDWLAKLRSPGTSCIFM